MVDVARGLATLATRPPTPPRGTSIHRNHSSISEDSSSFTGTASVTDTPVLSPSSSAEDAQPVGRVQKRVGFSPWTEYHKAPLLCGNKADENHFKRLQPSRERRTSHTRSILKPFARSTTSNLSAGVLVHNSESFAAMLESVVQQLAGESRSSRLDAYLTLSGTLKAYEGVPDRKAIADKMGLLMQFMRRDMCATINGAGLDTILVVQTLKLLTMFIWSPELSDYLSEDFQSFVVDRSLFVLEEQQMPKAIVTHHMHLLATQKFKSRVLTTERANRLITSLDQIQDRVKGNGILGQKLLIYQRLLGQARSIMVSRVLDWIDHVFSGMLSTFKATRVRAIAFGLDAGLALGTISTASRAVTDIFNRSTEDGKKFINHLCERLGSMALSKEDGAHVPQIWSVPVLFLRARRHQLEHWEHMKAWLHIIQRCFNASDTMIKFQANIAWNRLVFAINPDKSTGQAMTKMLRQPLVSQLDRKATDKHSKQVRQVVLASYCNLLYYALKPSATHQQLDVFWTQYVSQVFTHSFLSSTANLKMGCQILTALLGDAQPRPWNENRANELGPVKPEELPRVDPKWVRSRVTTITTLLERIFDAAGWSAAPDKAAPVTQAWHSFMRAIGDAGSKEVKVSAGCMEAVAEILNMLQRLWQKAPSGPDMAPIADSEAFASSITTLLEIAMQHIGPLPFSEILLMRGSKGLYHVPVTPSHHSASRDGSQRTPIVHMLDLLLRPQPQLKTTDVYRDLVKSLLAKAIRSRTARGKQLELLRDWMQVFSQDSSFALNSTAASFIWAAIAELAGSCLTTLPPADHTSGSPRSVGHEYRDVVKILEVGLRFDNIGAFSRWEGLCKSLIRVVRHEAGDGGVIIAVIEPLASLPDLKDRNPSHDRNPTQDRNPSHDRNPTQDRNPSQDLALDYPSLCLEELIWPSNGAAMERSRKAVWGVASTTRKAATFDPLDKTYDMITHFLTTSYQGTDTVKPKSNRRFLTAVLLLLHRVPLSLLAIFLKRVQSGLTLWVKDADRKLHLRHNLFPETRSNVVQLWSAFTGAIETLPNKDSSVLRLLEPLILSGFQSKHRGVVNESIRMWNNTFGCLESLDYPDSLRHHLQRLRGFVDLQLPNFPESPEEEVLESLFDFIESQENQPDEVPQETQSTNVTPEVKGGLKPSAFTRRSLSSPMRQDQTPGASSKRTTLKTTPTARLRHDDSQVQFAAIESSPVGETFLDSQLLTDRQRKVKERQQAESAAMFPDLRSSPRPKSCEANNDLPRISFVSDPASNGGLDADESTTIPLPLPQHGPMNDFIGSSPTPRSRTQERPVESDDIEPPSSPPELKSIAAMEKLAGQPSTPLSISAQPVDVCDVGKRPEPPAIEESDGHKAKKDICNHEATTGSDQVQELSSSANSMGVATTVTPITGEIVAVAHDAHHPSDIETFVDAPSSPVPSGMTQAADAPADILEHSASDAQCKEKQEHYLSKPVEGYLTDSQPSRSEPVNAPTRSFSSLEDNISRVLNSFGDDSAEQSSCNEGQVSSQLRKDLSKAVGKDDNISGGANPDTTATVVPDAIKKRKRKAADGTPPQKKAKIASHQSTVQVVIEVPRRVAPEADDSGMLDCIVVDSRPATARSHLSLSGVKLEQTPSPSKCANTVQKKPLGRPRKSAAKGDMPASDEMASPQSKKRKASESPTQRQDRSSASVTSSPVHKKRRSPRHSQTSATGSAQRSSNSNIVQEDIDAGAVQVIKSTGSAATFDGDVTAGHSSSKEVGADVTHCRGDDDYTEESGLLSNSSEPPVVAKKHTHVINSDEAGMDQSTTEKDETDFRVVAHTATESAHGTEGLTSDSHLGTVGGGTSIAEASGNPDTDTTKVSQAKAEVQDVATQTRSTPGRSQHASPNGGGILGGLKRILKDLQRAVLGSQEEREIDDVLFDIRKEVHEAGRRSVS